MQIWVDTLVQSQFATGCHRLPLYAHCLYIDWTPNDWRRAKPNWPVLPVINEQVKSFFMCAQVHIVSRALREAAERKAKKVHFYQNGHPYAAKLTVSIAGKDFHTFDQLCQFLTDKSLLHNGVQYIFTTNGRRVTTLNELEHDQTYVISGAKNFLPYPYGIVKAVAPRISNISNRYKFVREDDLRLLRPLSSKYNNVYANVNQLGCMPLQNNPDNRMITIVNNQNHNITSKVILNLKSPKSFDNLLRDLGQAVRMYLPKRMFTSSGLEVNECIDA